MPIPNPLGSTVSYQLNPATRTRLGPGPQNAHPRVHAAMSLPQIGHMDPEFLKVVESVKALLRYVWQTENAFTVPVSGTGGLYLCNFHQAVSGLDLLFW